MGADNMANQEGARGRIFGIIPTRERTATPVRPRPEVRPTPALPQPEKPPTKKSLIQRLTGSLALRALLATGALGGAGYADYQEIPAVHQAVDSAFLDHLKGFFNKEVPVTSTFDNNADFQVAQAGINANPIASTELNSALKDSIKPLEEKSYPQVEMLLPVQLSPNERVEVSKIWVRSAFNLITEKTDNLVFGRKITIPKEGTKIIMPVENAEIFQISPYVVDGQSYFSGVVIRFKGPDDTIYELAVETENEVTDLGAMDIIKNAPTIGKDGKYIGPIMHKDTINLKGLTLPPGTPILISNKDNVVIRFDLSAYSPTYPKGLPSNFNLIQDKQENGKILYIPATP